MANHLINEDPLSSVAVIIAIHADLTDYMQYNRGQLKK